MYDLGPAKEVGRQHFRIFSLRISLLGFLIYDEWSLFLQIHSPIFPARKSAGLYCSVFPDILVTEIFVVF
jgi:hypothetical protein